MGRMAEALALAFHQYQAGRLEEAESVCRQVLGADPARADALHLLGLIAQRRGQHAAAVTWIGRALAIRPSAETLVNLGNAWKGLGQPAEAIAAYRRAIELDPDAAAAHNNLGNALRAQGFAAEAAACCREAIRRKPDFAAAYNNLGNALADQGALGEAVEAYGRAVQLAPDFSEALFNLADALKAQGARERAEAAYRRSIALTPDFAAAHNNLGSLLKEQGRLSEAAACYRRALEHKPEHAGAHNNLGNVLRDAGALEEALGCYRRAVALEPDFAAAYSNLLLALQYRPGVTAAALREAHADYDRRYAAPLRGAGPPRAWAAASSRPGRLRLGFVSADFADHPVGRFLIRTLESLDRQECDVVCYSDREGGDAMTARFRAAADDWHQTEALTDQQLAAQVLADRIDILFDLAGHTTRNRLLVFARKPARIQITWLGYAGTTGLSAMDYVLADGHEIPPGAERHYCEKVLRLPDSYVTFDPPADAPAVGPEPALACGRLTFGSFNNPAKINGPVVSAWARVLRRVPGSRMLLKYFGVDDPANAERIGRLFAEQGIGPERLELSGGAERGELLAWYNRVDLALDTFPYGGGLTTCEALWMGVAVVTLPGETFAGRHSLSHLSTVGLKETIARDVDDYVDVCARLAQDVPRLTALRACLRQRVASSPLCDGRRLAASLMKLLRGVWEERNRRFSG